MIAKVLTLFGEEFVPEKLLTAKEELPARKRGKKTPVVETLHQQVSGPEQPVAAAITPKRKKYSRKKNNIIPNQWEPAILTAWEPKKQYYPIGEVAGLFQLNTSHIRFWTNEFSLRVRTNAKGDRLYNADQIQQLRMIYHLVKEKGFTIAGAKIKLKEIKNTATETTGLKKSLTELKNKLWLIRTQLDK